MRNFRLQFSTRVVAFSVLVWLGLVAIGMRATLSSLLAYIIQSPLGTAEVD